MTNPVPGYGISTPYGRRGSYWSCNEDSSGNGIHTGNDHAAPNGTKVVAARGGTVHHCNHGSSFGNHQIEITPGDGTRDFYAHLSWRVGNGVKVKAGDKVGEVGSEGNVTGPHLHFERHKVASGGWSCSIVVDPTKSEQAEEGSKWDHGDVYVKKLHKGQQNSDSIARLCYRLINHKDMPASHRPPNQTNNYNDQILEAVRYWQKNICDKDINGPDDGTSLSNPQANALFGDNYHVIEK